LRRRGSLAGRSGRRLTERLNAGMGFSEMDGRIKIIVGNIVEQEADAIVNAANTTLLGGGGVDGAIHRAAGPELLEECRALQGCPTGAARITRGYKLPAKWIIHTVGPVWNGGGNGEEELLASCYRACLALAKEHDVRTIAFPSISTGAYRFPVDRAARIALSETTAFLRDDRSLEKVIFVCFGRNVLDCYQKTLSWLLKGKAMEVCS
jgi:O-acetyl-ADP-ribose deacetylase